MARGRATAWFALALGIAVPLAVTALDPARSQEVPPPRPGEDPREYLRHLHLLLRNEDDGHKSAAERCDARSMQYHLEKMQEIARQVRRMARAAQGAGALATINPALAQATLNEVERMIAAAQLRKPINCGQPPKPPPLQLFPPPPTPPADDEVAALEAKVEAERRKAGNSETAAIQEHIRNLERLREEAKRAVDAEAARGRYTDKLDQLIELENELHDRVVNNEAVLRLRAPQAPPPPTRTSGPDCPPSPQPPASGTERKVGLVPSVPDAYGARLLAAQNAARAEVGSPMLQWDATLAAGAAAYACKMPKLGLVHAPREDRVGIRENLLQSLRNGRSPEQMVGEWMKEKANFQIGVFPDVSRTGRWEDIAHYSQIIWRQTTHVGCAVHADGRYDWLVCRYWPAGNIDGKAPM